MPRQNADQQYPRDHRKGRQGRGGWPGSGPAGEPLGRREGPRECGRARQAATQIGRQRRSRTVAALGILFQALEAHGLEIARHLGPPAPRGDRIRGNHAPQRVSIGRAFDGPPAGEQFVEHGSQSVDIGGRPTVLQAARGLLWGHVRRRPQQRPATRGLAVNLSEFRQAEVGELRREGKTVGRGTAARGGRGARLEQNVAGLDIAVQNAAVVCRLDTVGQRGDDLRGVERGDFLASFEPPRERWSGAIGRGDVVQRAVFAHFVNGDQVGMVERPGGLRFAEEAV